MKKVSALSLLALAMVSVAIAEVRVYQPPAPPPQPVVPSVSRGMEAAKPKVEAAVVEFAVKPADVPTSPTEAKPAATFPRQLEVFLAHADFVRVYPKKLDEFRRLPELQKLNLVPEVYIDRASSGAMVDILENMAPNLRGKEDQTFEAGDFPNMSLTVDTGNELARSYGIQGQSTIVYRDPAGAVRLYNLNSEVEKLQRQLAREAEAAQPAR